MSILYLGYHGDGHVDHIVDTYGEEVVGRHSHSPYMAAQDVLIRCGSDLWPEREDDLADQVRDHHGTHASSDIRAALDGREFVVLFDSYDYDDPDIRLLRHGLDPTRVVECGACEGKGGMHGLTGGYTVHGSGYGDASPKEGWVECDVCAGHGECELAELAREFDDEELAHRYCQEVAA